MAYCKTKTYMNLKRIADRAYENAIKTDCDVDHGHAMDLEMECATYAYENEDQIDWEYVKNNA